MSVAVRPAWLFGTIGALAAATAALLRPAEAQSAAAQDWPPFVLVSGLLLIGLVADGDGLFAAAGHRLAQSLRNGGVLFAGAAATVGVVTALLNLDTSVVFLTPVFVYAARSRGEGEAALLYGCLLLSNAGSLFLPGSNLTNLIVLGHAPSTGGQFLSHSWLPALAALAVTAGVVGYAERLSLRTTAAASGPAKRPAIGIGLLAIVAATVIVLVLTSPALPVAAIGIAAAAARVAQRKHHPRRVGEVLGLPVLIGLLGLAVGLGTLARVWSGPAILLSHLDQWGTAVVGAAASVAVNNLPAASLLSARPPLHPFALLIGLNLGPNLFVTGSLAWILWLRAARGAGAEPSIRRASLLGMMAAPLSIASAVGALMITGVR